MPDMKLTILAYDASEVLPEDLHSDINGDRVMGVLATMVILCDYIVVMDTGVRALVKRVGKLNKNNEFDFHWQRENGSSIDEYRVKFWFKL